MKATEEALMELLQLISSGDTAEYVSKHALDNATAELLSCAQSLADGVVSFANVIEAQEMAMSDPVGRAELKALFESLDKDGDGRLSYKEWMRGLDKNVEVLSKHFGGANAHQVGAVFHHLDTDKNGCLTWDEFDSGTKPGVTPKTIPERVQSVRPAEVLDQKYIQLTVYMVQEMERKTSRVIRRLVKKDMNVQLLQLTMTMSNISNTSVKVTLIILCVSLLTL